MIAGLLVAGALALGAARAPDDDTWAALFATGKLDELIERAASTDNAQARYWLGRAWLARGDELASASTFGFSADLADAVYRRAVEALGDVVGATDVPDDARRWHAWARYRHDPTDAELAADLELWFEASGDAYPATLRARQLADQGDPAAAEWYGRAVEASDDRGELAVEWAVQLAVAGRRDEALAAWRRATDAPAALRLASLLSLLPGADRAERRLAAIRDLIEAEDLSDSALAAWHEAYALRELDRLAEAEAAFARVAGADDAPAGIERSHAALLAALDRFADAAARLEPAVAAGDEAARVALRDLADELAVRRRHDEALVLYDRALDAEPRDLRAARNRALALSYAGRIEAAEEAWDALIARHPGRADLINDAALCAAGRGDHRRARQLWEAAVPLFGSSDARENLAHALLDEDPERARSLAESVLSDEPARNRALFLRYLSRRAIPGERAPTAPDAR